MAMIRGTMTSEDGKVIYCTCEHHKVAVPTQKSHLAHRVAWDESFGDLDMKGVEEGKGGGKAKL